MSNIDNQPNNNNTKKDYNEDNEKTQIIPIIKDETKNDKNDEIKNDKKNDNTILDKNEQERNYAKYISTVDGRNNITHPPTEYMPPITTETQQSKYYNNNYTHTNNNKNYNELSNKNIPFKNISEPKPIQKRPKNKHNNIISPFKIKESIVNLIIYSILCGVISFAALLATDQIIAKLSEQAIGTSITTIIITTIVFITIPNFIIGITAIFIEGTGNETLYKYSIIAVAVITIMLTYDSFVQEPWQIITLITLTICYILSTPQAQHKLVKK